MREGSATRSFDSAGIWLWIAALLVLAGTGLLLSLRWEEIPERFPIHWNARGEPDGWTDRSLGSVALPLLFGAGSCAFFGLLAWGLGRLEWGGERSPERRAIEAWLHNQILGGCAVGMSILFAVIAVQPLRSRPQELPPGFGWGVALGVVGLLAFVVWRLVDAGRRLDDIEPPPADERDRWRWGGLFYVDPDDPRLLVPKRVGIGWTLNMARPVSWVVLGTLLLPALIVTVLLLVLPL